MKTNQVAFKKVPTSQDSIQTIQKTRNAEIPKTFSLY
jgi:hypothetical protein